MTDIQTATFTRKPLHVDAIRVSPENMEQVAEWCGGSIGQKGHRKFIRLFIPYVRTPRQTVAYSGDWITKVGKSFKVYTETAFKDNFVPQEVLSTTP